MPLESPLERELALAFGVQLSTLRHAAGLTQEKVAERAGMSRNHYQLLESGLSDRARKSPANPRLSTLLDIADALGCEPTELVKNLKRRKPTAVHT